MKRRLLIWDGAGSLAEATMLLLRMGIDTFLVESTEEARAALDDDGRRFRALAFPPEADLTAIARLGAEVAARDPESPQLALVAIGSKPAAKRLADLRQAGVRHAVWSQVDASALRFVVNAALTLPNERVARSDPRAPVNLLGSFEARTRTRQAVVYTLSPRGAFLETPRPLPKGVSTRVTIRLPGRVVTTRALTIHANDVGDRRAPRWPIGMSVLFGGLSPEAGSTLRRFVMERLAQVSTE